MFCYDEGGGQPVAAAVALPRYLLHDMGGAALAAHWLDTRADPLHQLQLLLEGLHLPQLQAAAAAFPQLLQQDLAAKANCFCAALCEAVHARAGRTVLYVPAEASVDDPAAAARQRELVQRLEAQMLSWTRHIRSLLAQQSSREWHSGQRGGPDEVAFWRQRTRDLGSLRDQLEGGRLSAALRVLEAARSPHLPAFLGLRSSIAEGAAQAASNLAFLEALEAPCARLATAEPAHLAQALPPLLDACRVVWTLAPRYGAPEQMTGLLRLAGNAVVSRCRRMLDMRAVLGGRELPAAERSLEQCCEVVGEWRAAYDDAARRVIAALPGRPWDFEAAAVHAHVEAFVQRCRDLLEICAARRQFECDRARVGAVFGGSKAPEVARALGEVQQGFAQQMRRWAGLGPAGGAVGRRAARAAGPAAPPLRLPSRSRDCRLQDLRYDMLDVRCSQWYEDVAALRAALRGLDRMLGAVLAAAYAHAPSLACKLDVVEAFALTAARDGLRRAAQGVGVWAVSPPQGPSTAPRPLCPPAPAGRWWRRARRTGTSASWPNWRPHGRRLRQRRRGCRRGRPCRRTRGARCWCWACCGVSSTPGTDWPPWRPTCPRCLARRSRRRRSRRCTRACSSTSARSTCAGMAACRGTWTATCRATCCSRPRRPAGSCTPACPPACSWRWMRRTCLRGCAWACPLPLQTCWRRSGTACGRPMPGSRRCRARTTPCWAACLPRGGGSARTASGGCPRFWRLEAGTLSAELQAGETR